MNDAVSRPDATALDRLLREPRPLPSDPIAERIVLWRTFRSGIDARAFAAAIQLGEGQSIVGGCARDSLGDIFWLGVQVADLAKWGNTRAIQRSGRFDPEDPDTQGRPFES